MCALNKNQDGGKRPGNSSINMSNIYLVGFMGTGKTSVGKKLAQRKNWHFVDLDELIELKEKMTIVDIFAQKG